MSDGDVNTIKSFDVNVIAVDYASELDSISDMVKIEDNTPFMIELNALDSDGDVISYSATSSDTEIATVSIVDNNLTLTPVANANGVVTIDVNVTANGKSVMQSFDLNITAVNDLPSIDTIFNNLVLNEDNGSSSYDVNISDVEGVDLDLTIESNNTNILTVTPNWSGNIVQGDYQSKDFNLTTVENANGIVRITIRLSDGDLNTMQSFDINVTALNDTPVINTIANISKNVNFSDFNIALNGITDIEKDDLNISFDTNDSSIITLSENWINDVNFSDYNSGNLNLTISSIDNKSGVTKVNITISDGTVTISKEFNITVADVIPNDFSFYTKINQEKLVSVSSETLTITKIDDGIDISITGGEYKINDGNWNSTAGIINNNDNITVRLISSGNYSTTTKANLTIGTVTRSFSVITKSVSSVSSDGESSSGGSTSTEEDPIEEDPTEEDPTEEDPTEEDPIEPKIIDVSKIDISKIETGDTLDLDTVKETSNELGQKVIEAVVTNIEGKEIKIELVSAVSNSTTIVKGDVLETKAKVETDDGTVTETTVFLNKNGTTQSKLKSTNNEGIEIETQIQSSQVGTKVEIAEDGGVEMSKTLDGELGSTIKAKANEDGSSNATMEILVKDENGEDKKVVTKTTSQIKGAVLSITKDGAVQTKAKTKEVEVLVESTKDGKSTTVVSAKDENGKAVETKVSSNIAGADTTIKADGGVEVKLSTISGETKIDIIITTLPSGESVLNFETNLPNQTPLQTPEERHLIQKQQ